MQILGAFDEDRPIRGVTDLADELGMDKSRVHRILVTLQSDGFVQSVGTARKYALGPALITLGNRASRSVLPWTGAQLILERLARTSQESAVLCTVDGLGYRTVASADGPSQLRFATELGRWFPGNAGATGHVLFAHHSDPQIAERLANAHAPQTPGETARIVQQHAEVRAAGYLVSKGEFDPRVMAIAAPVRLDANVFAALAAVGNPAQMGQRVDQLVGQVLQAADELEQELTRTTSSPPTRTGTS